MKIGRTILATIILVISLFVAYHLFTKVYIGGYLSSYGTELIIREMIGTGPYVWTNIACILAYVFRLITIWAKG